MGPLIEPARGKLLSALTTLGRGESWLVEPTKLDRAGQLWTPGLRDGVSRGSEFHLTEYFGPVLGIMTARTLDEAIDMVNDIDYGLTSGLHALDSTEIDTWLERVDGGNLYVNRGTTGAIVQRQPFGGWKKSSVGAGAKAGGPNYLFGLGTWSSEDVTAAKVEPREYRVRSLLDSLATFGSETASSRAKLNRAAALDVAAWDTEFGVARDVSNVGVERNVFRYRAFPAPVIIRFSDGADPADLVRVVLAAFAAGTTPTVSASGWIETAIERALDDLGVFVEVQTEHEWRTMLRRADAELAGARIRLVGGSASAITMATGGRPDLAVWSDPVVMSGRLEMLPFLREQAISITAHRFGTPNHLTDHLELGR
jgi:RHH-type proline utilization regulon transcriptional repressor/proline dehydrogenase/delta 1-pyrroline-5-carboxylate dehydrogenase